MLDPAAYDVALPTPPMVRSRAESIAYEVASRAGLRVEDLKGANRKRQYSWPRQVAMTRIRRETGLSLPEIGRLFRRDHTTVLHAIRAVDARMEKAQ